MYLQVSEKVVYALVCVGKCIYFTCSFNNYLIVNYLPIQNLENTLPSISSLEISPVNSPK